MVETLRIVVLSDTHGLHDAVEVPDGDILIHAGDFTLRGSLDELRSFNDFLGKQPHQFKLVIAGNHDFCFQHLPNESRNILTNAQYLQDEATTISGVKFYGSPWQPWFMNYAFNLPRGEQLREKWARIPEDTDVLITHTPPFGLLDKTFEDEAVGCVDLMDRIEAVRPKLHLFGHIHECYGVTKNKHTTFGNASNCTLQYQALNPPLVFDFPTDDSAVLKSHH